ncbi:hypothetical protein SAMN05443574_1013 [Haloarcula vallismortis]|uniref:Uncharacterized protein n=2 Tax=Haloarcula vallismortis TaxID=28442 RepID=M0IYQ9_HALVA|nr:hypothetical protein [Haloarcula vallismortis]EMA00585.1 hypothetical protein C437_17332 [Haloarcula vallismortis ATCC 29715]SDW00871.1 hypothetical protein SAMN05443574_1013 [Haloarcula vallismortis]
MRLNRRSVLLGLGTISATVGGAFGSGAFSSVEATRTVDLNTSDDSDALLGFEPNGDPNNIIDTEDTSGDTATDGGDSVIKLQQKDLNQNATTKFNDALKVVNRGDKDVGVSVDNTGNTSYIGDGKLLDIQHGGNSIVGNGDSGRGYAADLASDDGNGNPGNVTLTIVINLQENIDENIDNVSEIVFAARQKDYDV